MEDKLSRRLSLVRDCLSHQHTQAGSCSASLQPVWFEQSSDSCLLILSSQFCHVVLCLSTHFSQAKLIQVAQEIFLVWFVSLAPCGIDFKSHFLQPLYDYCHYRGFWTENNCNCYSVFPGALGKRLKRNRSWCTGNFSFPSTLLY